MATIEEILKYPKGTPVVGLECRVSAAYPVRKGEGQWGPWTVMDLELTDATGTIKGQWWQPLIEDHGSVKGRTVSISAAENKQGDLVGATVTQDEYKNEKRTRIKVNGDALKFTELSQGPAATAIPNGALTLTTVIDVARRCATAYREILGADADSAAVAAMVNTTLIALTNGKVQNDEPPLGEGVDW